VSTTQCESAEVESSVAMDYQRSIDIELVQWKKLGERAVEKFDHIIINETKPQLFGMDFINRLAAKVSGMNAIVNRIFLVNFAIVSILFVTQYNSNVNIEFAGVKIDGMEKYKELLLFMSTITGFIALWMYCCKEYAKCILHKVVVNYVGDKNAELFENSLDCYVFFPINDIIPSYKHPYTIFLISAWSISLFSIIMFLIVSSTFVQTSVIVDVWSNPSVNSYAAKFIILLAVLYQLFQVSTMLILAPLPDYNYSALERLEKMRQEDPSKYQEWALAYSRKNEIRQSISIVIFGSILFFITFSTIHSVILGANSLTSPQYMLSGLIGLIVGNIFFSRIVRSYFSYASRKFFMTYYDGHPDRIKQFRKLERNRTVIMLIIPVLFAILYFLTVTRIA